jgi:hypothetical protein
MLCRRRSLVSRRASHGSRSYSVLTHSYTTPVASVIPVRNEPISRLAPLAFWNISRTCPGPNPHLSGHDADPADTSRTCAGPQWDPLFSHPEPRNILL